MTTTRTAAILIALLTFGSILAACGSPARLSAGAGATGIHVEDAWARSEVAGQNSAAYMVIENRGERDDRLMTASGDVAAAIEIHKVSSGHDHMMRMQEVDAIVVPAGESVALEPGGLHVMLLGLHADLSPGHQFMLTLSFKNAGDVEISVDVRERD